jgi:hypothetical protein
MTEKLESQLPAEIETTIGRFIANFSILEDWLRAIVLNVPNLSTLAGDIIASELSFRGLLNACGAIVHEYSTDPEVLCLTDETLPKIDRINNFRNQLVHSVLYGDMVNRHLAYRSKTKTHRKKGAQHSLQELRHEELLKKCDEIALLTGTIKQIYDLITTEHPPGADGGNIAV